ncbi:MAG: DUF1802 family protein [Cyanobacteria bacterium P01_F01_bin.143]
MNNPQTLTSALKEWAIAVEALAVGKTIILLRKGGIREDSRNFQIKHQKVWLYPTYEHQKPHLLKPEYADKVTVVDSGWHPETVTIRSYANITQVSLVNRLETLKALEPYHVWNEQMLRDRLKWKARQPLSILFLRVYNLSQPLSIPYDTSYGGCKSWIDLVEPISLRELKPVLDDSSYQSQVEKILSHIN